MRAKIKATGEIIEVEPYGTMKVSCLSYRTESGRVIPDTALEFEKVVDWEQRRYEIVKELMKGFASNPHDMCVDADCKALAEWSVKGADALIAELKKGVDYEND